MKFPFCLESQSTWRNFGDWQIPVILTLGQRWGDEIQPTSVDDGGGDYCIRKGNESPYSNSKGEILLLITRVKNIFSVYFFLGFFLVNIIYLFSSSLLVSCHINSTNEHIQWFKKNFGYFIFHFSILHLVLFFNFSLFAEIFMYFH